MKIYVRARQKVGEGVKQPKYRVVAVTGDKGDKFKVEAVHFRKIELETIAKDLDGEIVWLEPMGEEEKGKMK